MPFLHITLHSDWRIGSGTGRPGDIDQLIRRDRTHCPYLPAKTITGIWRDACERVAYALDADLSEEGPTWTDWVTYLFGNAPNHPNAPQGLTPAPAHLKVESAHLDETLRKAIACRPALQAALTFVKPGVKISDTSGSAEEQCFRLEEMARGGITLTPSFVVIDIGEKGSDTYKAAYALLGAGAALVERIGGKRRRGAGRCEFSLPDMKLSAAHDYLSKTETPPAPLLKQAETTTALTTANSSTWHSVALTLTTEQPVIISKGTVGNVVESLDYIPGNHLLPIVTRHLRGFGVDISEAITQSQFIITNALPCTPQQATAPIPFALFYEKQTSGTETTVINAEDKQEYTLTPAINKLRGEPEGSKQRKQYRGGYIAPTKTTDPIHIITVATAIETHNTVEDEHQRPTSNVGGVYSYQAIPTGTTLRAELRVQDDLYKQLNAAKNNSDQRTWYQRIGNAEKPKRYNIGLSRKDEYGRIQLVAAEPVEITRKIANKATESTAKELTVWLLSDLLLRDDWLRPTTEVSDVCKALTHALNLEPEALTLLSVSEESAANPLLARARRSESWQTRWGLPRPSLAGLSAGTCLRLQITGESPTLEALQKLETEGLGERRVEGYGQLRLNDPLLEQEDIVIAKLKKQKQPEGKPKNAAKTPAPMPEMPASVDANDATFNYAHRVELAAWRNTIQRAAATLAGSTPNRQDLLAITVDKDGNSKPSLSQLGTVRSQLSRLRYEGDTIKAWVKSAADKKGSSRESLEKVNGLLIDEQVIWQKLDFKTTLALDYSQLCCTKNAEATLKRELWAEAVEVLVGECIRAQSRESESIKREKQKPALSQEAS